MADFKINHDIKTILIKELLNETGQRYLYLVFSKDSAQGSVSQTADATSFVGGTKNLVYVVKVDTENDVYIGVPTERSSDISGAHKVNKTGTLLEDTNYEYIENSNLDYYLLKKFDLLTIIIGISATNQEEYNIISLVKCNNLGVADIYDYTNSPPNNNLFDDNTVQIIGQYRTHSLTPLPTEPASPNEIEKIKIDIRV